MSTRRTLRPSQKSGMQPVHLRPQRIQVTVIVHDVVGQTPALGIAALAGHNAPEFPDVVPVSLYDSMAPRLHVSQYHDDGIDLPGRS